MNYSLNISGDNALVFTRPSNAHQLHSFVKNVLGFNMPHEVLIEGHASPFSYLCHTFFESEEDNEPRDCVVWANRGGGKTQLGAIATLLDLIFKPGIQIRILAGSFEQSSKMYVYLIKMLEYKQFSSFVSGKTTGRHVKLHNGSRVEVLSQSEKAVRGQRIHKLRCDEVELFDDAIWTAAQMVTKSGYCGDLHVRGAIEVFSTMHRPFGLMQRLIEETATGSRKLFRWNVIDVLEKCPDIRKCDTCNLFDFCGGKAKKADGFFSIDDAISQMRRINKNSWLSEMLCLKPGVSDCVYPEFDIAVHVREFDASQFHDGIWLGGADFGYRSPTVLLWAWLDMTTDVLYIVDEQVEAERTAQLHIEEAMNKAWPRPEWIGVDPAGNQRNDHTGTSTVKLWRNAGWRVKTTTSLIQTGVETVRDRLHSADGTVRLQIHTRCRNLIKSLQQYHFPPSRGEDVNPVKDGPDHAADALRYMVVNLDLRAGELSTRSY